MTHNGTEDVVLKVVGGEQGEAGGQLDYGFDGSKVTFNGLTIKTNDQLYAGYARLNGNYYNCIIEGAYCLQQSDNYFENCKFSTQWEHNVWTWGATNISFKGCEFDYTDRCVNVYASGMVANANISFESCKFNAENVSSKGAIEINSSSFTNSVNVDFNLCTQPAYGEMVFISGYDNLNGDRAHVTIDGEPVTPVQKEK